MRTRISVVVLVVAVAAAAMVLRAPHQSDPAGGGWHEARPVYGAVGSGFFVRVDGLHDAGPMSAGDRLLAMQVSFRNQGGSMYGARLSDLQLVDSSDATHMPDSPGPGCAPWAEGRVAPGAAFGPATVCFHVAGASVAPRTLVWQPDVAFAFLSTANRIPLPPIG
jgi:hypothetical protein